MATCTWPQVPRRRQPLASAERCEGHPGPRSAEERGSVLPGPPARGAGHGRPSRISCPHSAPARQHLRGGLPLPGLRSVSVSVGPGTRGPPPRDSPHCPSLPPGPGRRAGAVLHARANAGGRRGPPGQPAGPSFPRRPHHSRPGVPLAGTGVCLRGRVWVPAVRPGTAARDGMGVRACVV